MTTPITHAYISSIIVYDAMQLLLPCIQMSEASHDSGVSECIWV